MSQDSHNRAFAFSGTDADYIAFLEAQLSAALRPSSSTSKLICDAPSAHPISENSCISNLHPAQQCLSQQVEIANEIPHPPILEITQSPTRSNPGVDTPNPFLVHQEPPSPPRSPSSTLKFEFFGSAEYNEEQSNREKESRSKKRPRRQEEPQALKELKSFINQLEDLPDLTTRRHTLGLSSIETNRNVMQFLCGDTLLPAAEEFDQSLNACPLSSAPLVQRGCAYGALYLKSGEYGELLLNLNQYRALIFVSMCHVFSHVGIQRSVIEWMLGRYVSGHWKSLQRVRLGSLWVNRCMSKLLGNFGPQVWDLILLYPATIEQYGRFSGLSQDEGRSRFEEAMASMCEKLPACGPNFIPYCIPCIIKVIAGEELGLIDICNALEYDFLTISSIYASYFEHPLMTHAPDDSEIFNPYQFAFNSVLSAGQDILIDGFEGQL